MGKKFDELLVFQRGLDREFDIQPLQSGHAQRLINLEPTPIGGLRPRRSWRAGSQVGVPPVPDIRSIGHLRVHAGWETPIVRQGDKRGRRAKADGTANAITAEWWQGTQVGSLLVAVVSWSSLEVATSTITCTPPTGWTSAAVVHSNDAPSTVSMQVFYIANAAEREGSETFTFSTNVRRAIIRIMEWDGIEPVTPLDATVVASGYSTRPDTGLSAATDPAIERGLVLGAITARTLDESIQTSDFPEGYYDLRDPGTYDRKSHGSTDYWLNQTIGRKVLVQPGAQRFYANLDATAEEDDAKSRWVAALVTFKGVKRGDNDRDYCLVDAAGSAIQHRIHSVDFDDIDAGAWTEIGQLASTNTALNPISFATGFGATLMSAVDFVPPQQPRTGLWFWNGRTFVRVNRSPAARTVAFFRDRFYAASSRDYPSRMWWSQPGDPTTWPEDNYIDVGNGENVYDISPVLEGMLIGKEDALYYVQGSGSQSSGPLRLSLGSAMPGRSICPVPGGAVIAGREHIWFWGGGKPELISRRLNDWWRARERSHVHTAYVNGRVHVTGGAENTCVVIDLDTLTWWTDQPPTDFSVVYSLDYRQLVGGVHAAGFPPLLYQLHPGSNRDRDELWGQSFEVTTPEYLLGSAMSPATPRHLYVAWQQRNTVAGDPGFTVTPVYDGQSQTPRRIEIRPEDGDYRIRLDVGVHDRHACHKAQYIFTRVLTAVQTTMIDIEQVVLRFDVEEPR